MNLPQARSKNLLVEELAEETLVYDLETNKASSLNPTAAMVWRHCDGKTDSAEVARLVAARFNAPESEDLVTLAVGRLAKAGLLEGAALSNVDTSGITRRAVMKKLALTGGLALLLPAIHSIVAPTPAEAQTCLPNGAPCTANTQCCSGHCNPGLDTCQPTG